MKVSVVVTVLNEAETILALLFGLLSQSLPPQEVIIVDGGSTDLTLSVIKTFQKNYSQFPLRALTKKGNRSVGRNFAISQAKNDLIAITDAGCVPHQDWVKELVDKISHTHADVVAGYYEAAGETSFQAAVVPYMLVMPDQVDSNDFLPATRSMMIRKSVWVESGGFDESLEVSEDYEFAQRLKKLNFRLTFTDKAKVAWWPIDNLREFFSVVTKMAGHDAKAKIIRPKVYLVFFRYLLFFLLSAVFLCLNWLLCVYFVGVSSTVYLLWAMWKNAQYLDRGWLSLAILQLTADLGVMWGTIKGSLS